jgi:hypothetical protein
MGSNYTVDNTGAITAASISADGSSLTSLSKAQVGLDNVDNTSDADKPVSTATQDELDLKSPIDSPTFTGTVNGITASMVGLGDVANLKVNLSASTAPAATDDGPDGGYSVGSRWFDTTADREYVCLDASNDNAVWIETTITTGGATKFEDAATIIGDDVTTDFVITHNFNSRAVVSTIFNTNSPYDEIIVDVEHTSLDTITVKFSTAPATGEDYTAVVIG